MSNTAPVRFSLTFAAICLIGLAGLATPPIASAKPDFLTAFVARYPSATRLFGCGICHRDFNGPQSEEGALNSYGQAFEEAGGESQPASALATIEGRDSDNDGTNNVDEILQEAGFMPGYSCSTYATALNAPIDLVDFVDPNFVGCGVTATTSTLPSTTTTLPGATTTSTTLPIAGCAQPVTHGSGPTASDCLLILQVAVGSGSCEPSCMCAPKGSLPTSARDALVCLRWAVGQNVSLDCPCSGSTSTTSTTVPSGVTTTTVSTTTSSTTTTTVHNAVLAGQQLYDSMCAGCHSAVPHDNSGFAVDLAGKGAFVVPNLGSIDPAMSSFMLTDQQVSDLAAFLNSL